MLLLRRMAASSSRRPTSPYIHDRVHLPAPQATSNDARASYSLQGRLPFCLSFAIQLTLTPSLGLCRSWPLVDPLIYCATISSRESGVRFPVRSVANCGCQGAEPINLQQVTRSDRQHFQILLNVRTVQILSPKSSLLSSTVLTDLSTLFTLSGCSHLSRIFRPVHQAKQNCVRHPPSLLAAEATPLHLSYPNHALSDPQSQIVV